MRRLAILSTLAAAATSIVVILLFRREERKVEEMLQPSMYSPPDGWGYWV